MITTFGFKALAMIALALGLTAPALALAAAAARDAGHPPSQASDPDSLLAVCAVPVPLRHRLVGHIAANLPGGAVPSAAVAAPQLLLRRDDAGYDIVFDNGRLGQWSLRGAGAKLEAPPSVAGFLQLMARQHGAVEQYLFRFDNSGEGVLLWSADRIAAANPGAMPTARAECLRGAALGSGE